MLYTAYIDYYKKFLKEVIIDKTNVLLPKAYVSLDDFSYPM
jgi:hypothetical protein